jgi:Iap family predicted aminopeptidase
MAYVSNSMMQDYGTFVDALAKVREDRTFFNSGPNHAAIVMSRIFKYSDKVVRIFSGGFNGAVSNDSEYLQELEGFLSRGGKVQVVVEKDLSDKESTKIYKVLRKFPDRVAVYQTDLQVLNQETKQPVHFAVGDETMLRVETSTDDYTAQVNFGNVDEAATFIKVFDQLLDASKNGKISLHAA